MAELNDRIVPLDDLDDFEVADGDPDVRGWDVIASDGRRIGEVNELLIDTAAMKVRYLDVNVDDRLLPTRDEDRHILIPIGYARLDENDDQVIVDQLASTQIGGIPAYSHEPLTRDYEMGLAQRLDTGLADRDPALDLYEHELYDDRRFFDSRRGNPLV